jgi:long-subunit fatty acid transport protein
VKQNFSFYSFVARSFDENRFKLGIAIPCGLNVFSTVNYDLSSSTQGASIDSRIKPICSFGVGGSWKLNPSQTLSLSYFDRRKSESQMNVDTRIPFGPLIEASLELKSQAAYQFSPRRVALNYERALGDLWDVGLNLKYSQWSELPAPIVVLTYSSPALSLNNPLFQPRNTWEFSAGLSHLLQNQYRILTSYKFAQSPFVSKTALFKDANQLLVDFFEEVDKVLDRVRGK